MFCLRKSFFKAAAVLLLLAAPISLTAQEVKNSEVDKVIVSDMSDTDNSGGFNYTYSLGFEYTYAFDMPHYHSIPYYDLWQQEIKKISARMIDPLGKNGHILRVTNNFEWRKDALSFTLFANATLNYIPAFLDTALDWLPGCIKAGNECMALALKTWGWALSGGWLIVNACTAFVIPIFASTLFATCGAVCYLMAPCSVAILSIPMAQLGGSVDYHPYYNDIFDTKLSFGIDIDGYRAMMHMGILGLYTQAEANVTFNKIQLYTQAGYRLDFFNLWGTVKTSKGTVKPGYEGKYVPAPYVKAGIAYRF